MNNLYIDRIGIEFEGFFKKIFLRSLIADPHISQAKNDGSICADDEIDDKDYEAQEVITRPLIWAQMLATLQLFKHATVKKQYLLNETTGLHYHISLHRQYYAYLVNPQFYRAYCDLVEREAPTVYNSRKNNQYCRRRPGTEHYRLQSLHRYAFINYSYEKHRTIEFRAYGGQCATIDGLERIITATAGLIADFCRRRHKKIVCDSAADLAPVVERVHLPTDNFKNQKILLNL